jgi:signal transduction histidine kinase
VKEKRVTAPQPGRAARNWLPTFAEATRLLHGGIGLLAVLGWFLEQNSPASMAPDRMALNTLGFLAGKTGNFGVALFALASMFIVASLLWWNAKLRFRFELERAKTERRLTLQYNCTQVLAESQEKGEVLPKILQAICQALNWRLGAAWIVNKDAKMLTCIAVWHAPTAAFESFVSITRKTTFQSGIGLPGRVWETGKPVWVADVTSARNFPRAEAAAGAGLHGAFGFPVRLGLESLGVFEFFSTNIEPPDSTLMQLLESIGIQIGQFIERQRAENELRLTTSKLVRSNADLQQFASLASHDLLEPLRMVMSFIELLQHHCEGKLDKRSEEFIQLALDGAKRMKALINDLLAYSRVDRQKGALEPTSFEDAFHAAVGNLRVAIEENAATITHEPLPTIRGDAVQVSQVFQNLLGNAIKFHGAAPPRIHVTADQKNGEWLFSVRDNGIGIEPKHFGRIFEIFQRLHTRREYPGTGMGLAICKRIIERHGGKMWVESTLGKGTTFFFTLPAVRQG